MAFSYQFSDTITIDWLVKNIPQFLFPDLSKQQSRIHKPFVGVIATQARKPIGLILASSETTSTVYRIHSFLVRPSFQRRGIGIALLQHLETAIKQRGGQQIEGVYRSHWQSVAAIQKLLTHQNWTPPQPQLRIAKGTVKDALSFFPKSGDLNNTFSFSPFTQIKKSDLEYIRQQQAINQWFDPDLSPLTAMQSIHLPTSFLVKKEGQIIGWIVSHQLSTTRNELTALFIDKNHRSFRLTYALIQTVFEKQLMLGIPNFITTSKMNGNAVVKFLKRAGEESGIFCTEVLYSSKAFSSIHR